MDNYGLLADIMGVDEYDDLTGIATYGNKWKKSGIPFGPRGSSEKVFVRGVVDNLRDALNKQFYSQLSDAMATYDPTARPLNSADWARDSYRGTQYAASMLDRANTMGTTTLLRGGGFGEGGGADMTTRTTGRRRRHLRLRRCAIVVVARAVPACHPRRLGPHGPKDGRARDPISPPPHPLRPIP